MDNKKIITASFLIIALSIAYYFVIFLPNKEQKKLELERLRYDKEQAKEKAKFECLAQAHDSYKKKGEQECIKRGYTKNDIENLKCQLPKSILEDLLKQQDDWQKSCLEIYK
jgi:hypothetical protein